MTLKELIKKDNNAIFMQLDDFGELHEVDGKQIVIVIDTDELEKLKLGSTLGVTEAELLFFATEEELPDEKAPDSAINIDGMEYIVDSWSNNLGIVQVTCHQNRMF